MLSRIQSLYLLLAALLAFGSMTQPFWSFQAGQLILIGDFTQITGAGIIVNAETVAGGLFSPATAIASIAAIFSFKNRKMQRNLIMLCYFLFAGDILSSLTAAHFLNQYLQATGAVVSYRPEAGFFMLLPEPVLFWLASLGVKKDEKIATAYKRL
jgi:hypothetical protein